MELSAGNHKRLVEMREEKNIITTDDEGLEFALGTQRLFTLRWQDVSEIVAYKEDLFGCDSVCIAFRTSQTGDYVRVFEEAEGYREMLDALEVRFPGMRKDWFNEVAFPAFVPNWTTLWRTS